MPIYEYRCSACGHELEALQKLSDSPLKDCPSCGQNQLTKLISAAGFQLKGGGWYATDFKNSGKPAEKKNGKGDGATASAEGAAAKSESTASDSSAASKSETKTTTGGGGGCGSGCSCH
jgi:putative FmdB family regulatory protein